MSTAGQRYPSLFYLFFCSLTAVALRASLHEWRPLAVLTIWATGTGMRLRHGDRQVLADCIIFGLCNAILARVKLKEMATGKFEDLHRAVAAGSWFIMTRFVFPLALPFLSYFSWHLFRKSANTPRILDGLSEWTLPYPEAKIFPCETKHARIFPRKHAFAYSYLQCGFPIVPAGVKADGSVVGGDNDVQLGCWWMRIKARDYLMRDNGCLGFYNKLRTYLRDQNVDDTDWSYAYLVTAPRFLGYAFNPVSFWYIYDSQHQLKKMILEVNNTFGERRIYLLNGSKEVPTTLSTDSKVSVAHLPSGIRPSFNDSWKKDFHVSPFNSRQGSYVLRAQNPFTHVTCGTHIIDNTITLISSKNHAKLVASLKSTGPDLDPAQMGMLDTARFVLSWWWVGLVTFPRIVREAGVLFFKKSLHVWYRPEILRTCISRVPTLTEIELHKVFEAYLHCLVDDSQEPLHITLETAVPTRPIVELVTWQLANGQGGHYREPKKLHIRILTPDFYSRFVHYAYTSEAFEREGIFTDEKNRTLWISQPQLLPLLLSHSASPTFAEHPGMRKSFFDELRWNVMKKLRCPPASPAYAVPTRSKDDFTIEKDARALPFSEMDQYMRSFHGNRISVEYRRIVTKLFLAHRFGFGFTEALGLVDFIVRLLLCWLGVLQLAFLQTQGQKSDIGGCITVMSRDRDVWPCFTEVRKAHRELWCLVRTVAAISACNAYGLVKGYN